MGQRAVDPTEPLPDKPSLAANYSSALMDRLAVDNQAVDIIKVSEFDRPELLDEYAAARRRKPLILHGLGHAAQPGKPGFPAAFEPATLRSALAATDSVYLSAHLSCHALQAVRLSPDAFLVALVADIDRVREASGLPVLLENGHWYLPVPDRPDNPEYIADPAFIATALAATGCRLLLDLAHARIAAWHRGEDRRDYLSALPLDLVDEIHVVGVAMVDDEPRDRHQEMDEDDYATLAWVLERAPAHLVTLEYGGVDGSALDERSDATALGRQLERLRAIISGIRGGSGR